MNRTKRKSNRLYLPIPYSLLVLGFVFIFVLIFVLIIDPFLPSSSGDVLGLDRSIKLREYNPGLTVKEFGDNKNFEIDVNGFIQPSRVHDNPDGEIVFLGGSTTACLTVPPLNRFPYKVGRLLEQDSSHKINTYNGGVHGNATLHTTNILINKIIPMKPTMVVMMHNINDLAILIHEESYWNNNKYRSNISYRKKPLKRAVEGIKDLLIPNLYFRLIPYKNMVQQNLTSLLKLFSSKKEKIDQEKTQQNVHALASGAIDEFASSRNPQKDIDEEKTVEEFSRALKVFVEISRIYGIKPVLMTQANLLHETKTDGDKGLYHWAKNWGSVLANDAATLKTENLYRSFNEAIREVALSTNTVLIDLDRKIPKQEKYFFDIVHLSEKGSLLAASVIAGHLVNFL